jgi:comEA protein
MLNLTTSETRAIIITALIITGGGIIQFFKPHINRENLLDYSESDSVFVRRSYENPIQSLKSDQISFIQKSITDRKSEEFYIDSNNPKNNSDLEIASININSATYDELQKLPRIGPALAQRIIEYRTNNGQFRAVEELINVKGIGKKTLENLKPFLVEIQ